METQVRSDVLTIILAGGEGARLFPLTRNRAKPAVHFGGLYRLIDFTLSNAVNSGLRKILVLVQYKSLSLSRHIRLAWSVTRPEMGEFIEVVPPQMRVSDNWYLGTADAIYQNIFSINMHDPRLVLILSSDHIYKMNYGKMIDFHEETGADLTIGAIQVPVSQANRFGVLEVDEHMQVVDFQEKPENPKGMTDRPGEALASMGIYLFKKDVLTQSCEEDAITTSSHDFGKDILPRLIKTHKVCVYSFEDENRKTAQYWRDVGTIDSYYEANMDLTQIDPEFNLYDHNWPIHTLQFQLPPAKFGFAQYGERYGAAVDSIVSHGCIISGSTVYRSILSPGVRVHSYGTVEDSILFQDAEVGRNCHLRYCIVEKGIKIPEGTRIGFDPEEDARRFFVSPGGVTVVHQPFS